MLPRRPAGGRRVLVDPADAVVVRAAAAVVQLAVQEAAGVRGLPQLGQEVVVGQLLLGLTCENDNNEQCALSQHILSTHSEKAGENTPKQAQSRKGQISNIGWRWLNAVTSF